MGSKKPKGRLRGLKRRATQLLGIVGLVLLAVATLPWYLGWCLQGAGSLLGIHFANYQRLGYMRFVLSDVSYSSPDTSLTVTCQRLELPQPLALLFKDKGHVAIDHWRVVVDAQQDSVSQAAQANLYDATSVPTLFHEAILGYQQAKPWLGVVELKNGTVVINGAVTCLQLVHFKGNVLSINGSMLSPQESFSLHFNLADIHHPNLTLQFPHRDFTGVAFLAVTDDALKLNADITYNNQHLVAGATWQGQGVLPRQASLYGDVDLAQLTGLNMSGRLKAQVTTELDDTSYTPTLLFTATGNSITYQQFQSQNLEFEGTLHWPRFMVKRLDVELAADTAVVMQGEYDLQTQRFNQAQLKANVTSSWVNTYYPLGMTWEEATLDLVLDGTLDSLKHRGNCHIDSFSLHDYPQLAGSALSFDWQAQDTVIEAFQFQLSNAKRFSLTAEGKVAYHAAQALQFAMVGETNYQLTEAQQLTGHIELSADGTLFKHAITINHEGHTLLHAQGKLPLSLHPDAAPHIRVHKAEAECDFLISCTPDETLLENVLDTSGWSISNPSLQAKVTGRLNDLCGSVELQAAKIAPSAEMSPNGAPSIPPFEDIRLVAQIDHSQCAVTTMEAFIDGHKLSGEGSLPLALEDWQRFFESYELPSIEKLEGALRCTAIPLASLSAWLPQALRPEGFIQGDISLKPGRQWQGNLEFKHGATYPLPPFGALRNINTAIRVQKDTAIIEELAATLGNQPIRIHGSIDMQDLTALGYDLHLKGEAIPLVRSGGIVLKGSPDLRLYSEERATKITGAIRLLDSFVTVNLADLQTNLGGGQTRQGTPLSFPYFSLEQDPIRSWKMDIDIQGNRFLRIRTPGFSGAASIDYHLGGSLAEPLATGKITLEQGNIKFPFASFATGQTEISTTMQSPFEPQIFLNAQCKTLGYEITMQGNGSVINPEITFTSIPQLDSREILLLITTGQIPQSQYAKTATQRLSGIGMYFSKGLLAEFGWFDPKDNRLHIRIGEDISETGRDTLEVEYELTDDLSGVGHYDLFDTYNIDLHWKILER